MIVVVWPSSPMASVEKPFSVFSVMARPSLSSIFKTWPVYARHISAAEEI
jgi:hypothetical protein